MGTLEILLLLIVLLWLFGWLGPSVWPAIPHTGSLVHLLLVVVLVLLIVKLARRI